ncbi:MAG TPA: glycosyltransferase family 2 protein [Candidatus Saccharimonadales bacterium]|nr:glycosyltransferase family 2 protein [Candidatus Saccharimonadales bacterium]
MYRNKKITICFPCRNEGDHLKEVIARIPKIVDEIIVISNKSTDNTVAVAKKLGVKVIEDNRSIKGIGYGFAHISGIEAATGDLIVGADGDATYPVEELEKVIDHLLDDNLDFLSCNRYPLQAGTKIPFKLRLGVWVLNTETRVLHGVKINDILSGMWVFRKSAVKKLDLTMGDWNLSPQIKINAARHPEIKFSEHSIAQHQRMGESHQAHYKTGFSHLFWIFKSRWLSPQSLQKDPDQTHDAA